jgi:hypothetical protein
MAWTTPATWTPGQVVTASDLNTHLRDNLNFLFSRPNSVIKRDNNANYTTTSTSFVDVDGTNLKITLTITGSVVLLAFTVMATSNAIFDILIDSTRYASGGNDGLLAAQDASSARGPVSAALLITGLSAGAHTFKLQWKAVTGTATLYAGSGVGNTDFIPTLWAVEVG